MRKSGYYWVKYDGCYWVAEYNNGFWYLPGIYDKKRDQDLSKINEIKIPEPENF